MDYPEKYFEIFLKFIECNCEAKQFFDRYYEEIKEIVKKRWVEYDTDCTKDQIKEIASEFCNTIKDQYKDMVEEIELERILETSEKCLPYIFENTRCFTLLGDDELQGSPSSSSPVSKSLHRSESKHCLLPILKNKRKSVTLSSESDSKSTEINTCEDQETFPILVEELEEKWRSETQTKAENYMGLHKITDLFKFLCGHLLVETPANPIKFLIKLLDECIEYRSNGKGSAPLFFQQKHIESLFKSMDPLNNGYVDLGQYETAMFTLGILKYNRTPQGHTVDKISKKVFIKEIMTALQTNFNEMITPRSKTIASVQPNEA